MRQPSLFQVSAIVLLIAATALPLAGAGEAAAPAPSGELHLEPLDIVGVTPLPGLGQPLERVPANVQQLDARDLQEQGALSVMDALGRSVAGVHVGQTQNNPFQPDVLYRGFLSSALLGTAQGLSVFSDGVRLNEFLGDTVNWDLVPEAAIASIEVVPGSDPLYGRNTLGGALALQTKRGFTHPGSEIEASAGSFGRRRFEASTAGSRGAFDYLVLANVFHEDGFRDFSKSDVRQVFGEAGWRGAGSDLRLTYTGVDNEIRGNSSVPESFLAEDRGSVYTQPDVFQPELHFVNLLGERSFGFNLRLSADFYLRDLAVRQSNADAVEEDSADDGDESGDPASDEPLRGVNRFTRSQQRRTGGSVQLTYSERPLGGENDLAVGMQVEHGRADFRLFEEPGIIDAARSVRSTAPGERRTDVDTHGDAIGVYASDTFSPWPWLSLTPALRWDHSTIEIDDLLGGGASGSHEFDRVSPAFGATVRPDPRLHFFAGFSESFRAPTAIELTCASESDPCPLPIAFAEDPPLAKVRARTIETGFRSHPIRDLDVRLAFFRTDLDDDILFVSRSRSLGFFRNVGRTRRQGLEALFSGQVSVARWFASYSYTRATFETEETLPSPLGENRVRPGDVIPGIPDHLLKAGAAAPLGRGFRVDLDLRFTGRQFLRTDEANEQPPLGSYTVVDAGLEWSRGPLTLFARAENLLDAEYETAGAQGVNVFNGRVERFLSPGAPLGGWFGLRLNL